MEYFYANGENRTTTDFKINDDFALEQFFKHFTITNEPKFAVHYNSINQLLIQQYTKNQHHYFIKKYCEYIVHCRN
jgi:hypothetical protein